MNYLELITSVTFCSYFIMLLLNKWGLNEYYQLYRKDWMPKPCNFCWAWWVSILVTTIIYLTNICNLSIYFYILVPMISTAALRLLNR